MMEAVKTAISRVNYLLRVVSVHLHELADIKLGCTQNLDLPDKHTLQWVDSAALLLNVLACRSTTS